MQTLLADLRFAVRMLVKSRAFTAVAVLCLALGVGVNSAVFSLVDGYWTRPLPVRDPSGLVYLSTTTPRIPNDAVSYAEYLDYESRAESFAGLLATERRGPTLTGSDWAESTMSNVVSENYFTVLGESAQLGRVFTASDVHAGRVVVMSHNLWQRRFGGDVGIIGRSVQLNGSYVVIGIAPKGFRGTELWQDSDFWIPMSSWNPSGDERHSCEYRSQTIIGRLRPGVSIQAARNEVATIAANLERAFPASNKGCRAVLATANEHLFQGTEYLPLKLLGLVTIVLLLACANLANLLLARGRSRSREIGVRLAIGASRGRIVLQLMIESALLCALGTAVGLLFAEWLISLLPTLIIPPADNYLHMDFRLDQRVFAFTLVMSLLSVLIVGLIPALRATRIDVVSVINFGGRELTAMRGHVKLNHALAVIQMALSVILLVDAGLLLRTLLYGMNLDLGFARRNVVVAEISPPYDETRSRLFYRQLLDRVHGIPGVREATLALRPPLGGSGGGLAAEVRTTAQLNDSSNPHPRIRYTVVDLSYFRTLGVRLLQGRDFAIHDGPKTGRVVIINETMSRRFWPGDSPIGKTIQLPGNTPSADVTIVGVVRDTRINSITEPGEPYFYLPYEQSRVSSMYLIAQMEGGPLQLLRDLRAYVAAIDSRVPVLDVTTMELIVRSRLYQQQVCATLAGGLGVVGLLLAVVGLYGLMSYSVTQRTREIGIRMALGAQRRFAMTMVLRQALTLTLIGMGIGLVGSFLAAGILSTLVYGVNVHDSITYTSVILTMLIVSILASYFPALRSTKIDPIRAIRQD